MNNYIQYYKNDFQTDIFKFLQALPDKTKFHYSKSEITIQYFTLTPNYDFLDTISTEKQPYFFIALFWTVLIDQVVYTHFKKYYSNFQRLTLYPKFIGNCTGTGFFTSECGHHQHPKKILFAMNDYNDSGNRFDFDKEPFLKNIRYPKRQIIAYEINFRQSIFEMEKEISEYFKKYQPEIDNKICWQLCLNEL